ncbi:transposase [Paenibacillus larvae]|nr:transposase [Paenibacillus larvae]MDT2194596.1 transposase [Paenibacillus larvae]
MVVNGVSTRKVSQVTEELCGTGFSKSALFQTFVSGWIPS